MSADEIDLLSSIERLIQKLLPRREIEDFEPTQILKETTLNHPVRRKKPRKPLNRDTNKGNNSKHNNSNKSGKRKSVYGQGPKPGAKAKRPRQTGSAGKKLSR